MDADPDAIVGGDDLRIAKHARQIAAARDAQAGRVEGVGQRAIDAGAVDLRAVGRKTRRERVERRLGGPPRRRHRCDPARVLDDLEHAADAIRRGTVDLDQPGGPKRPLPDRRMHHIGQADVACEIRRPIDLCGHVEPWHRSPDQLARTLPPDRQRVRRGQPRRRDREIGEPQPLAVIDDEPLVDRARRRRDIPSRRRRLAQQRTRTGPSQPTRLLEHPDRCRSPGQHRRAARRDRREHIGGQARQAAVEQLVERERVGVERIDRRGLDTDGTPVGAQFVRHDLRQRGIDALAMFELGHRDADMAVGADLQPGSEDRLTRIGDQVRRIATRPDRPGDHQPHACAAADQEAPSADRRHARALSRCRGREQRYAVACAASAR